MLQAPERSVAHLFAAVSPAVAMVLRALEAFDIKKHARWPKGHPSAGKFRPMPDLLKKALRDFDGEGHPFDSFNRDQLMRAAKAMDISLSRGESRDSIAGKVFAKLDPKGNFRHDLDEIQAKNAGKTQRHSRAELDQVLRTSTNPSELESAATEWQQSGNGHHSWLGAYGGDFERMAADNRKAGTTASASETAQRISQLNSESEVVTALDGYDMEGLREIGKELGLIFPSRYTEDDMKHHMGRSLKAFGLGSGTKGGHGSDSEQRRSKRGASDGLEGAGATDRLASVFHENWRASRAQPNGGFEPRVKTTKDAKWKAKHGTDQVDIANTPFEDLPEDWQAENRAAAKVVVDLMRTRGNNLSREEAGAAIHDAWLERNDWARGGDLDVPFAKLPKDEQDKDVEQYDAAVKLFGGGSSDGLDDLTDPQLASLATEFEVPRGDREQMLAGLRAAGAVSPQVRAQQSDAVSTGEIRQRVDTAFDELAEPGREWVGLADLRKKLGGTREDQDKVLLNLVKVGQIELIPEENQKTIRPEDRAAALNLSGEDKHLLGIVENGQMRRGGERSSTNWRSEAPGSGEPRPPSTAREMAAENDARDITRELGKDLPGALVRLPVLRDALAAKGYTRQEQDAAISGLASKPGANLIPIANLKSLSDDDRLAAVKLGGENKHAIAINDRTTSTHGALDKVPAGDSKGAAIAALRQDLAGATPGSADHKRITKMLADMEGAKPARGRAPSLPEIRAKLIGLSGEEGRSYLDGLELNQTQTRALAKDLGVKGAGRATAEDAKASILRYFDPLGTRRGSNPADGPTTVEPTRVRAPKAAAGANTGRAALKVAAADAIANPTGPMPADDVLNTMTVAQLKDFHEQRTGSKLSGVTRKADIIAAIKAR